MRRTLTTIGILLAVFAIAWLAHRVGTSLALSTAGFAASAAFFPVIVRRESLVPVPKGRNRIAVRRNRGGLSPERRRALILGAGDVGKALGTNLEESGRYEVVGFIDDAHNTDENLGWPILGKQDATAEIVNEYGIDNVFLAFAPTWQHALAEELTAGHPDLGVQVVPAFYESMMRTDHVETIGDMALVPLKMGVGRTTRIVKRLFDTLAALIILTIAAPAMLIVAVLIKLTSSGPVIFAQERVGQYSDLFTLFKFRTMFADAETRTGPILSPGSDDPRITPVGKWLRILRIDELPQLLNVLKGEMSLVGPRPERAIFVARYEERDPIYVKRHLVRPGITGLAQVFAGYHTDGRDKLRFDLIYISNQSVALDIKILFQTLLLICRSRSY